MLPCLLVVGRHDASISTPWRVQPEPSNTLLLGNGDVVGVTRMPRALLRLEGAAVLAAALALYFDRGYGWLALVLLVLAPDVSMLAYLAGPRAGARVYDLVH